MVEEEKVENITQDIGTEKLIKGYVDTVFNIWRMGKDARLNYEDNKKKLTFIQIILDDHRNLIRNIDRLLFNINRRHGTNYGFDATFNPEQYIKDVEYHQKALEKTLTPLKNLSKKYDRILKILRKNGFQIVEFEGKKFNDGMSIRVLGYDTRPGLEEDTIIETVKPTIFFNDKEYLKGEVIVSKKADDA